MSFDFVLPSNRILATDIRNYKSESMATMFTEELSDIYSHIRLSARMDKSQCTVKSKNGLPNAHSTVKEVINQLTKDGYTVHLSSGSVETHYEIRW